MTPLTSGAGVELAYRERGAGTAVLLIHGMAADAESWGPVAERLAERARVIAYDRRGYGASQAPEGYRRTTVQEQAQDAESVLRSLDADPVVLCGEDFGALICLELALRHALSLAGLVLVEPATLALVPQATEALSAQRSELERALREHGPSGAVEVWLSGWGDDPNHDPDRLARARGDVAGFFADYAGLASLPVTRRELRGLTVPTRVVDGPGTPSHLVAAGRVLAELIPGAVRRSDGDVVAAVLELLP
ncbi:MAG TPA: alpha/beta hydrolase [Solirubrobacteraceae bacterium]|jgi:3-oxoadipate enol-lactonase|nr:alpha/beta hydrolase [Solirubrobacteraceae bacterium]